MITKAVTRVVEGYVNLGICCLQLSSSKSPKFVGRLIQISREYRLYPCLYKLFKLSPEHPAFSDPILTSEAARFFQGTNRLPVAVELMQHSVRFDANHFLHIEELGDWVSYLGKWSLAKKYWHEAAVIRRSFCRSHRLDDFNHEVVLDDWISRIGHFIYLECFIKLSLLGRLEYERVHLVVRENTVSNFPLLRLFRPLITVQEIAINNRTPLPHLFQMMRSDLNYQLLKNDEGTGVDEMSVLADNLWREQKRGPLVSVDEPMIAAGERFRESRGMPQDAWFVCVHAREPGYVGKTIRDCDIRSYFKMFKFITDQGGWVIRLGDESMTPLPPMTKVVDYALSKDKDPNIDIYLAAKARYFIGCASGMGYIPHLFDVPSLFVNWAPICRRPIFSDFFFIPKTYFDVKAQRPFRYDEIIKMEASYMEDMEHLRTADVDLRDNTDDQIHESVVEFFDIHQNNKHRDPAYFDSLCRFDQIARENEVVGEGWILPGYLKTNPEYVRSTSQARL